MAIDPVSLPTAAGINYGEGDVRHFSDGDHVGVPGLQGPTRHLAERDNLLADRLNEVIGVVNNRENFVSVPTSRIIVPPGNEEIVANFRIPAGYESRVFNAFIFAYPASSSIELNVYYSAIVGSNTGEAAVTTTQEFTAGTKFYPEGEFIITVKNTGNATLDMGASVTLTLRPLDPDVVASFQTSSPSIPGPPGPRGSRGDKGDAGGAGASGSPGLQWRGAWADVTSYSVNDIVSYNFAGTSQTSSFVCLVAHNSGDTGAPQPSLIPAYMPFWDYMAQSGAAGAFSFQGAWSASHGNYALNDVVSYVVGGATSSYICKLVHVSQAGREPTNATYWTVFATSSSAGVSFGGPESRYGWIGSDQTSSDDGDYLGIPSVAQLLYQASEHEVAASTSGLQFIWTQQQLNFPALATALITLPDFTGATDTYQWLTDEITLNVVSHGSTGYATPKTLDLSVVGTNAYQLQNLVNADVPITLSMVGIRTL